MFLRLAHTIKQTLQLYIICIDIYICNVLRSGFEGQTSHMYTVTRTTASSPTTRVSRTSTWKKIVLIYILTNSTYKIIKCKKL